MPVLSLKEIDKLRADYVLTRDHTPADPHGCKSNRLRVQTREIDAALAARLACKPCPFCEGGALVPRPTQGTLVCVDCGALCLDTRRVAKISNALLTAVPDPEVKG